MLRYSALFFLVLQTLLTGEVVVQFDPSNPEIGPFPTDFLTVPDSTQLTGRRVERIRIVGGGSKNRLLNQFTADATGRTVLAGPAEATALGNVAVQILASGGAGSLREVRTMVERSLPVEVFESIETDKWNKHFGRFQQYTGMA